jgi:hypothetical protein
MSELRVDSMESKYELYIVILVGLVAVVALIVIISGGSKTAEAGQAYRVDATGNAMAMPDMTVYNSDGTYRVTFSGGFPTCQACVQTDYQGGYYCSWTKISCSAIPSLAGSISHGKYADIASID